MHDSLGTYLYAVTINLITKDSKESWLGQFINTYKLTLFADPVYAGLVNVEKKWGAII